MAVQRVEFSDLIARQLFSSPATKVETPIYEGVSTDMQFNDGRRASVQAAA